MDPGGCVRLLSDILGRFGLDGFTSVRLAVPANATPYDVSVLSSVVFSATGSTPEPVASLLAGAVGAGLAGDRPVLVADLGVGLFEVGVVFGDELLSGTAVEFGAPDYRRHPARAATSAADAVDAVLASAPRAFRSAIASEPIHLLGGEARINGFAEHLSARSGRRVVVHGDAGYAVTNGLLRLRQSLPLQATS
jgi:actin-like ATPase involved in cell morphogenesis